MRNPDQLRDFYHDHLMRDILSRWERCGKDYQFGGFMHCITRAGEILSEEKEMVWQGLGLWTFSHVWLVDYARHLRLREFLIKTRDLVGRQACDARGRWPGKLDREGEPVAPAAGVEPALAAACGLLEYHRAMCDEEGL